MTTLVHADIFFFVTTIAVIVVAAALTVALVYFIKVLRDVRAVSKAVKEEADLIREDIRAARENVKNEGFRLKHLISFFSRFQEKKQGRNNKKPSEK